MTTPTPPEERDPRDPPPFEDSATDEERNRLQWAWRDGFTAGVAWLKHDVQESLAEVKQQVDEIASQRPAPWEKRGER